MPYLLCKKIENDVYNFPTWQYCKYKDIFDSRIIINSTAKFYISISYQKDLLSIDTRIFTPSQPIIKQILNRPKGDHIFFCDLLLFFLYFISELHIKKFLHPHKHFSIFTISPITIWYQCQFNIFQFYFSVLIQYSFIPTLL